MTGQRPFCGPGCESRRLQVQALVEKDARMVDLVAGLSAQVAGVRTEVCRDLIAEVLFRELRISRNRARRVADQVQSWVVDALGIPEDVRASSVARALGAPE